LRLADILFSGTVLDWCYELLNDDYSPLMRIWRTLGLEEAQQTYLRAMESMQLLHVSNLRLLRQVVEFIRDVFGKELSVQVALLSVSEHRKWEQEESFAVSESLRQLPLAYKANAQTSVGLPYMQKALAVQRKILSTDDTNLYVSINSLASMLRSAKQYDESIALYEEAIENRSRLLGKDHPKTLISIASFAFLLNEVKRYDQAMPYHHIVYQGRLQALGIRHPKTLIACYNYGVCLRELQYLQKAQQLFSLFYTMRRDVLGESNKNTQNAKKSLHHVEKKLQEIIEPFPDGYIPKNIH
jgi:tetratricopeptide (TPR) repeat protein